ncbi:hypothetical protein [Chengkuizengella axinellae]|uniref:Sensor histidine kinase n=1 Tax=Chengkuizengella axinellae TaxID=3064388 RepID=A0ABT9J6E6_9BACL|nr:hypothetical protein [Chengkuizengella sp. 2205SS18-9]MDP5277175.1 hypothetical protein [Chengkuizengella sp. 2205SS18-9]
MTKITTRIKLTIIFLLVITVLTIALQFTTIQYAAVRFSTSIYITLNYNNKGLMYEKIEYVPQFNEYAISYKDNEDSVYTFMVKSKRMPFIISHDPLDSK